MYRSDSPCQFAHASDLPVRLLIKLMLVAPLSSRSARRRTRRRRGALRKGRADTCRRKPSGRRSCSRLPSTDGPAQRSAEPPRPHSCCVACAGPRAAAVPPERGSSAELALQEGCATPAVPLPTLTPWLRRLRSSCGLCRERLRPFVICIPFVVPNPVRWFKPPVPERCGRTWQREGRTRPRVFVMPCYTYSMS